jgi:membrane-bound serine protease (ClpP class)
MGQDPLENDTILAPLAKSQQQNLLAILIIIILIIIVDRISTVNPVLAQGQQQQNDDINNRKVLWIDVKDFISSGTAEEISAAVHSASPAAGGSSPYSAIVLALDTPGGSLDATFHIIDAIQQASVPVIGYVYPTGKSAWSAGTILLLATDYAVMAPVTTIGSAQPVVGTEPVNDTKIVNAVAEKAVSLAELHKRNATQAARFVTHNDNLTPEKALKRNVIEAIAANPEQLFSMADGATVITLNGEKVLHTVNAQIINHELGFRTHLINFLSNPLIATTFMTVGFFVLIYGLTVPGFGVEIAGAVMIILGLIGQGLDTNWGAFALLAIGVGLVAYELYNPGFGAIGVGGIVILAIGAAFMITQPVQPLLVTEQHLRNLATISFVVISPFAGLMALIIYKVWKVKKRKPQQFVFMSQEGIALDPISGSITGFVIVGGEYWKAKSRKEEINKGDKVKVVGKEASILVVEGLQNDDEQRGSQDQKGKEEEKN